MPAPPAAGGGAPGGGGTSRLFKAARGGPARPARMSPAAPDMATLHWGYDEHNGEGSLAGASPGPRAGRGGAGAAGISRTPSRVFSLQAGKSRGKSEAAARSRAGRDPQRPPRAAPSLPKPSLASALGAKGSLGSAPCLGEPHARASREYDFLSEGGGLVKAVPASLGLSTGSFPFASPPVGLCLCLKSGRRLSRLSD